MNYWHPILNSSDILYNHIKSKLYEIEEILSSTTRVDKSLLAGDFGVVLFYFYFYKYSNNIAYKHKAMENLYQIFYIIQGNPYSTYTYCDGITGFAWLLEFLRTNQFIAKEDILLPDDIESSIVSFSEGAMKYQYYDYLHGGLGAMLYFLQKPSNDTIDVIKLNILNNLEKIAQRNSKGMYWHFQQNNSINNSNDTDVCLGMAHGLPGIISILTLLAKQKLFFNKCKYLVELSLSFLTNSVLPTSCDSYFSYTQIKTKLMEPTRLGWCYGDMGIAFSFYNAGITFQRQSWIKFAEEVMRHSSFRRNYKNNPDGSLCHGTSGIAHLFNRFYQYKKDNHIKESAIYWYKRTLNIDKFTEGYAGYKTFDGVSEWENNISLLNGVAGIGLSLLSSISYTPPDWDRCLLLS